MRSEDVAIIGAAVLLPQAHGLAAVHELLAESRDTVGQPTPDRLHHNGGAPDTEYLSMGYLDRVDLFDHRFFGIAHREAELMDPHQRLVLQLTHEAIENACYAPKDLRGTRTAVFLGHARSDYENLIVDDDPQQVLGTLPAALAARISYRYDLTGPAYTVDTACSSSLVAVVRAVQALRAGEAALAIAGGISVRPVLFPMRGHVPMRGVESPEGRCRPFDEQATGAAGGEGGGVFLLKPLPAALAAGDHVHAVLKGVAVNHNGCRMASMSAPSQAAQTEVITAAWRDAGVEPRTIGYVEGHGSATPLGDVVEVDALRRAFLDAGVSTPHCALGSIKGNIGHLDSAAGIAGLAKVMLSVRRGMLYPTAHFRTPNPLIDFSGPVQVNPALRPWPPAGPRRAGLSSFGLTGTNVHVVVEQPAQAEADAGSGRTVELVTVSARSAAALRRYRDRLADFAERAEYGLAAIGHAMNRGRDDYPYRIAVTATDPIELAAALRSAAVPDTPAPEAPPVVLLFSGDGVLDPGTWERLCTAFPVLDEDPRPEHPAARLVAIQCALYGLARSLGLPGTHLVGSGAGNLAVRVARGELSRSDGLAAAAGMAVTAEVDRDRLSRAVEGFARDGAVLVELGADGVLSRLIRAQAPALGCLELVGGAGERGVLRQLGSLYRLGIRLDWDRYYAGTAIPRIEAPTYPFEEIRCWCVPPGAATTPAPPAIIARTPARTVDSGDTERRVAEVWQRVLGTPDIGPGSDYFALGGTSIAGMSALRTLEHDFGIVLTFADLYAYPTAREFAARITELRAGQPDGATGRAIEPVPRGGRLPLSFGQEQLWYLDRLNPGSPLYNIPHDLRLRGPLDTGAVAAAVRDLVARHEVLRTRLPSEDGEPYVALLADPPELAVVDLTDMSEVDRETTARRLVEQAAVRPFDLATGPLVRATLLRLAEDDHVLLWTYHHIVFDGWSPTVFFRDFSELYQARVSGRTPKLPDLPVQYADFAAWQRDRLRGETLERGLDFWRAELSGLTRAELPLDRPRPAEHSFAGDIVDFPLDAALTERIREFSQRSGVTTFVTMLAVADALLHRWAGLTDVVIGVATSGRTNPETHDLIGYFNNLPPFRTRVSGEVTFTELVRRCASTVAGVLDHEEMPLDRIVAELAGRRDPARHPLFDVAYTYQNVPQDGETLGGLDCTRYLDGAPFAGIAPGTAKFDLTVGIIDQPGAPMHGYLEYATALFDRDTIARLAGALPVLIDSVLGRPDRPLAFLEVPAATAAPADPVRLFEKWAADRPDHPAAHCQDGAVRSYRELNRAANRLTRRLIRDGVGPDVPVPVLAERGPGMLVGWLAVAKAGGAYVPIDPAAPAARNDELLAELAAPVVLTGADLVTGDTDESDDQNPPPAGTPANLAYITYTSGSTGRPQGCEIERHNLAQIVRWYADTAGINESDRHLQAVSPAFDASVLEVWGTLARGATLCFLPDVRTEPGLLLRWITENGVTVAFLPTPLAEVVLTEGGWPAGLPLRLLCTGGDRLRHRPPRDTPFPVLNLYGPTECTVVATAGPVRAAPPDTVPDIGRPVTGTEIHLLGADLQPVRNGQWGELCIAGAGVGRGYRRNPGLTATRFVADPFGRPGTRLYRTGDLARLGPDATLEFGGRLDDQLEVRGQRVEPAEIERALAGHPRVREALVVAAAGPSGSTRLVAHVTGDAPDPAELISWTAGRLPGYMVPGEIVVRDRLPRTPSGKLDRRSLAKMSLPSTVNGSGLTRAERVLTEICADLLAVPSVSPSDNFFDLGGDSILGVRVAARAAKAGVQFTPQQLLQCHTVGELATVAVLAEPDASPVAQPETPDRPIPPIPIMLSFLERVPDAVAEFVDVHTLETAEPVPADTARAAVGQLLVMHEALRYRFPRNGLGTRIECGDPDPAQVFDSKVLPPLSAEELLEVIADDCAAVRAGMDPQRGPVVRVRHYDRGRTMGSLIVLLINHFVYDNMSTVVLLDDLDMLLTNLLAGRTPAVTPRPPRWREWSEHLRDMSTSDEAAAELTYWTATMRAGAATGLIGGSGAGGLTERTLDGVSGVLAAGAAEGREAALCAASYGLARWRGTASAYVMTEGEATPNPFRLAGRGPSVGWFTTLHPIVLPVDPEVGVREYLSAAVERIRSVPNDGVGYGILRHLSPGSVAVNRLRELPEPQVVMLHGVSDTSAFDSGIRLLRTRWDLAVSLKSTVESWFPVLISTAVRNGSLRIVVGAADGLTQDDLEALADEVARAFAELAGT
ncbi:MAG TPA: amino acid adenylation domain-containing protein [Actinophytocola sp.]|uniref:non-ribosomal peptide synthetase n=1 Tax=Actinophytocola sp. TaxID=1872138 RepID=UPI002DB5BFA9|nr:non-ribosomal peptide synthetase [Actinophytocola sp.]HEU5470744.1 amino acid adenylation domain-containing protein [Actinophytocola sp.]